MVKLRGSGWQKHWRLGLVFVAMSLFLTGCAVLPGLSTKQWPEPDLVYGKADIPDSYLVYAHDTYKYSVAFPEVWEPLAQEGSSSSELILADPGQGPSPSILAVIYGHERSGYNLTRVAESAEKEIRRQAGVSDFEVAESLTVEVNGLRGLERVLGFSIDDQALCQRIIYLDAPECIFVLAFLAREDDLGTSTPVFDSIIHSFNVH